MVTTDRWTCGSRTATAASRSSPGVRVSPMPSRYPAASSTTGERVNGLALCAGAGGLELGIGLASDDRIRTVCYVEREAHAAATLVARMDDGALDPAPVWDDIATFDGRPWRGVVDIVSAGYPCQPFSVAGDRRGAADPRHLWPHVARIIDECGANLVVLENVPGHLSLGFEAVAGDLERMGFRVACGLFSARGVGAPHRRERLFVVAHRERDRRELGGAPHHDHRGHAPGNLADRCGPAGVPDPERDALRDEPGRLDGAHRTGAPEPRDDDAGLADPGGAG